MRQIYSLYLILIFVSLPFLMEAQITASMGAGYTKHTFLKLSDESMTTINASDWDLVFVVTQQGTGISVNEGSSYGGTPFKIYLTSATDFSTTIDNTMYDSSEELKNDESSWDTGALNKVGDPNNQLDLGWGTYNTTTHEVEGSKVFVIKYRDGTLKKFMVTSLIQGIYNLKYANLDGTSEQTATINKADFPNAKLAFFSFTTGATIQVQDEWDIMFARYGTILSYGGGTPYTVTGVLSGYDVKVAEVDGVELPTLTKDEFYTTYIDSLKTELDIIGHDWKSYSGGSFSIVPNRTYFLKNASDDVYKINFVDFEGSSTGVAVLNAPLLTNTTNTDNIETFNEQVSVYPNPIKTSTQVTFYQEYSSSVNISIMDAAGKLLSQSTVSTQAGKNIKNLDLKSYASGIYFLSINTDAGIVTRKLHKI